MPLFATYHITDDADRIEVRARALAVEQTIEFPPDAVDSAFIHRQIIGAVEEITPLEHRRFAIRIRYDDVIVAPSIAQFITVLFGNASLLPDVTLADFTITPSLASLFPGPRFGIPGIRQLLGISGRALTCAVLKPMGLTTDELLQRLALFVDNGIDIVKEDHGLNDFAFAPFAERVQRCQAYVEEYRSRTGRPVLYCPTLNASPTLLYRQVEFCTRLGIAGALVIPAIIGLPTFAELRQQAAMVLMAHPALSGAVRWSPASLLGKMFRLLGADISIFPYSGGRFRWDPQHLEQLTHFLRQPLFHFPPAFPAPAGGLKRTMLATAFEQYGRDTVFMIGGDLFRDPQPQRAIAQFVETIHRLSA